METVKFTLSLILVALVSAAIGAAAVKGYYAVFTEQGSVARQEDFSSIYDQAASEVVMFGTSTCPYCAQARELFVELDIPYYEYRIDNTGDPTANELFYQLGGKGVPILLIGSTRVDGFLEQDIRLAISELKQDLIPAF